jgi:hypothetical protein
MVTTEIIGELFKKNRVQDCLVFLGAKLLIIETVVLFAVSDQA